MMVLHAILTKSEGLTRLPNKTIAKLNNFVQGQQTKITKIQDRENSKSLWIQYNLKKNQQAIVNIK